jgi:hypothetical protein
MRPVFPQQQTSLGSVGTSSAISGHTAFETGLFRTGLFPRVGGGSAELTR